MKNVLEKTSKDKIDIFNLSKKFILIKVIKMKLIHFIYTVIVSEKKNRNCMYIRYIII